MPTDFASVHACLENAQAELSGSDPITRQMRDAINALMDVALKAEYSPQPQTGKVVPFSLGKRASGRNSRHG